MWVHPLKHIAPAHKRAHHPSDRSHDRRRGTPQPQAIDGGTNSSFAMASTLDGDARPQSRVSTSEQLSTATGPHARPASVERSRASTPGILKKNARPEDEAFERNVPQTESPPQVIKKGISGRPLVRSQTDLSPAVRANDSARGGGDRATGAADRGATRSSPNAKRSLTARAAAPSSEWRRYAIEPTPLPTSSSLHFKARRVPDPLSERAATAPLRADAARQFIRLPSVASAEDSPIKGPLQASRRKSQYRPEAAQRETAGRAGERGGGGGQECKWPSMWEGFDIRFAGGLADSLNRAAAEWRPAPAQLSEANVHRFAESQLRQATESMKAMLLRSIPKRVAAETLAAKGKR